LECTRIIRKLEADGKLRTSTGAGAAGGRIPIIAVTASEAAEIVPLCLRAGMNSCVFKPYNKQQMLQVMAEAGWKQTAADSIMSSSVSHSSSYRY
jgi:CheY-like chemotaxis protein